MQLPHMADLLIALCYILENLTGLIGSVTKEMNGNFVFLDKFGSDSLAQPWRNMFRAREVLIDIFATRAALLYGALMLK